jgi:DNA gyrase subunit A
MRLVEVVKVESQGIQKTYDIEVENRHRFFANGVLAHNCMGKYHPHGDKSIFDSMVEVTQSPMKLIDGYGNWGDMTSNSGAMRYINCRLSKYSDKVFFDSFYLPTMESSPNYDGSQLEPINLVTLLPNGLLNGNFGLCPGVNTRTPSYTLPSMLKVLKQVIADKGKCSPELCKELVWVSDFGGALKKNSHNRGQLKQFYKTGVAMLDWESTFTLSERNNEIRFNKFAPFSTKEEPLKNLLSKVEAVKGVQSIDDDGEKTDPYKIAYKVRLAKTLKGSEREKVIHQVAEIFSVRARYDVKVTDRTLGTDGLCKVSLRPNTVPQMIEEWVAYRLKVEQAACAYWMGEDDKEIAYLQLMRIAISNLDFLFKTIKNAKLSDVQVVEAVQKKLKINEAQAKQVLARNLMQLRALEDKRLIEKIKEREAHKKTLDIRRKKPAVYVQTHLEELAKTLKV